jgi:RNA polymerase sigma-70 factor (ECF subfamily)
MSRFLVTRGESEFTNLFALLYPSLYRYFRARQQPHREAEELAQNVMVAVHRHAAELRDLTLFHGWLYRIARNELLMVRRHAHAQCRFGTATAVDDEMAVFNPENELVYRGTLARLLRDIDETSREVLHLRFVDELSYQDIAEALGLPIGTVKWRLYQAKLKLAELARRSQGVA